MTDNSHDTFNQNPRKIIGECQRNLKNDKK